MNETIGILGGGQLGKMLYQEAIKMGIPIKLMDHSLDMPVGKIAKSYEIGDFTDYNDVIKFGQYVDIITIEIEKINVEALKDLKSSGKEIFPQPAIIELIQDKGLQKQYYIDKRLPSSSFKCYETQAELISDIDSGIVEFPFVQKIRKGGYDGRGVIIINSMEQLKSHGFKEGFLIEDKVDIKKEISIITCADRKGNVVCYDPVEMVFDPIQNILTYQLGPAEIELSIAKKATDIAINLTNNLGIVGLLAIEMFVTQNDEILINEVAPRPHNSGHHSIEACYCSQYENHIRAIYGLPLGSTKTLLPSLLINILGEANYSGPVIYEGLETCLALEGVTIHIYGKEETRPNRKMGHVTVIGSSINDLREKYKLISSTLKAKS